MYQIAVCDDDPQSLRIISDVIEKFFGKDILKPKIQKYSQGIKLKNDVVDGNKFDIIIMDIQMPDINGLDLASSIHKADKDAILIFVTAYIKYAIIGYELSIFRYVPKNMLSIKLPEALYAARQTIEVPNTDIFLVEKSDESFLLLQRDIIYIYREGKNSVIVTRNNIIKVRATLIKTFEKLNQKTFLFVERGYIVNIEQIVALHKDTIMMKNKDTLPIGSAHSQETKRIIIDYWKGKINK